MEITDLMIGDWVSYCGFYNKVIYIGQKVSMYNGKGTEFTTDSEYIRPIPLTEEILVKNGFEKQEDVNEWSYYKSKDGRGQYMILWSMDYNYLEIGSYTEEFGEFNRMGMMRYVHQLQHALRLCGIEKEIEL